MTERQDRESEYSEYETRAADPGGRPEPYIDGPTGPAPLATELRGDPGDEGDRTAEGGAAAGAIAGTSLAGPLGGVIGALAGGAAGSTADDEPEPRGEPLHEPGVNTQVHRSKRR